MKARYVNPYTDFGFKKLFGEEASAEIANFTPHQLAEYEESVKIYRDLKGVIDTSYEEGIQIGEERGLQKGREEVDLGSGQILAPYLELFARQRRDDWTQWGDELDKETK